MNKIAHIHLSSYLVKRAVSLDELNRQFEDAISQGHGHSKPPFSEAQMAQGLDNAIGTRGELMASGALGQGGRGALLGGGIGALIQALRRYDAPSDTPDDKKPSIASGLGWGAGIGGGLGALSGAYGGYAARNRIENSARSLLGFQQ